MCNFNKIYLIFFSYCTNNKKQKHTSRENRSKVGHKSGITSQPAENDKIHHIAQLQKKTGETISGSNYCIVLFC